MRLLVFVMLAIACSVAVGMPIPDWTTWNIADGGNGNSYQLVLVDDITWDEAYSLTSSSNVHLATIASAEENAFVFDLCNNNLQSNWSVWLGAYCAWPAYELHKKWNWVAAEPFEYSNFSQNNDLPFLAMLSDGTWCDLGYAPSTGTIYGYVQEVDYIPEPLSMFLLLTGVLFIRRR